MERINQIIKNSTYQLAFQKIADCEKERIFCKHDVGHFMDVARIARILAYEEQIEIEIELIYATALLHDCGRYLQYENGIPHEEASIPIAERILSECGFHEMEQRRILHAIRFHRNWEEASKEDLSALIYRGDKLSRPCYLCSASNQCNRRMEKRNLQIRV